MASPLLDVDAFDRFVAQQVRVIQAPTVGALTDDEKVALAERFGVWAPRVAQLLEQDLWEQNEDVNRLADASYGYAIRGKSRERFVKLAVPESVSASGPGAIRASSDAELVALAASIGALPIPTPALQAGTP